MQMFLMVLFLVLVYFLPALIAIYRKHLNATAIFMTDFLLGWTLIGWVVALIWAFTNTLAPVSASGAAVAPATRKPSRALKIILSAVLAFVLLVAWSMATHKAANRSEKAPPPAAVRTGVPVPADELFGK